MKKVVSKDDLMVGSWVDEKAVTMVAVKVDLMDDSLVVLMVASLDDW